MTDTLPASATSPPLAEAGRGFCIAPLEDRVILKKFPVPKVFFSLKAVRTVTLMRVEAVVSSTACELSSLSET